MPGNSYRETFEHLFHVLPPEPRRTESRADILSPSRGFMGGFDFTMQTMVGCPAGCLFCYVSTTPGVAPPSICGKRGELWGGEVRPKHEPVRRLERHLGRGTLADRTIYWSGVTDPYAASPPVTRGLWEALLAAPAELRPRRIAVQTRFRADRDREAMAAYAAATAPGDGGPPVVVSVSIGTDRNDLIRSWERATPLFEDRMDTVRSLRAAGLCVVVTLSPLAAWHDLPGTLARLEAWGVAFLTVLFFKHGAPGARTPPDFLAYLRAEYPGLLDPEWQAERLREMEAVFGPQRVLVGQPGFSALACPHHIAPLDRL